jgi:hypothetical protein
VERSSFCEATVLFGFAVQDSLALPPVVPLPPLLGYVCSQQHTRATLAASSMLFVNGFFAVLMPNFITLIKSSNNNNCSMPQWAAPQEIQICGQLADRFVLVERKVKGPLSWCVPAQQQQGAGDVWLAHAM